jgi:PAS domain S-box-containing protein
MEDRILGAQASILGVALCAFILAALFTERRQHATVLRDSEARLQEALTAGAVTAFDWDVRSGQSRRSANAAQILGFDSQQAATAASFLARVHPDDRARFKALVRGVQPERPSYAATFRFIRTDGREMWLEETSKAEFDVAGRFIRFKGLTLDITDRKRAEERQGVLMAELDHRVKNVLARVAVVAVASREGSRSMDDFVKTLDGRIQSMATAHSLLSQSRWQGVNLPDLVRNQLAPYATAGNLAIRGPDVMLSAAATQAMAMVLHELATNAAKHGALSALDGRVSVSWDRRPNGCAGENLVLVWREVGGPPVTANIPSGYGTTLIRNLVPHELGGKVDVAFPPDGMSCRMILGTPLLMLLVGLFGCGGDDPLPSPTPSPVTPEAIVSPPPAGRPNWLAGYTLTGVSLSGTVYESTATGPMPIAGALVYCELCGKETHTWAAADANGRVGRVAMQPGAHARLRRPDAHEQRLAVDACVLGNMVDGRDGQVGIEH